MNKTIFITGILFGVLAIVLGAFAAHGLESVLEADAIKSFETGVRYQMYHALFLMIIGTNRQLTEASKKLIYYFIVVGTVFFSFSIYALATNELTSFDFKVIAMVTPFGGLLLIFGWTLTGYRFLKIIKK